ncbi:hypothetical protein [Bradyrhizobium sp.]|uniref:hypothetical protein n=1 Tax=Bradyrhizobium sp. TaxID=376 RepID=UPI001DCE761B|nr:hypothetical protein [Bradyrhizobium sp.]MBI5322352.1 hypothetical protein [Bradyrhizobium sp.]
MVYAVTGVVLYWGLDNSEFTQWDDFSHWGFATKELLVRHHLADLNNVQQIKDYPPGLNLFHFFVVFPSAGTEGEILTANSWVLFAILPCFLYRATPWSIFAICGAIGALFLAPYALGTGLYTVMSDQSLSIFFAGAIVAYWIIYRARPGSVAIVALPLAALPLIKASGALFAFIAAIAISIDIASRQRNLRSAAIICALIAAPVFARSSWQGYVSSHAIPPTFPTQTTSIWAAFSGTSRDRSQAIAYNFIDALTGLSVGISPGWSTALWCVVFASFTAVILVFCGSENRRQALIFLTVLWVGLGVYLTGLLTMYVASFKFGDEDLRLASFGRYVSTYIAGLLLVVLFCVRQISSSDNSLRDGWALSAIMVSFLFVFEFPEVRIIGAKRQDPFLSEHRELLNRVASIIPSNARVRIIVQNSNGAEVVRTRYALIPRRYTGAWSIGKPYRENDYYTKNITAEQFARELSDVDYLLLIRADQNFWSNFGSLFEGIEGVDSHRLFKISKSGPLKLVPAL